VVVVRERRHPHPLSWIHRAEAQSIVEELRGAGCDVSVERFGADSARRLPPGPLLLRLSDPVMLDAARALTDASIPYIGPSAGAMARCYDKYEAWRIASAAGIDCPATALARDAGTLSFPLYIKPRRGSDSIGVRLLRRGPIPPRWRTDFCIAQERIVGAELTIAALHGRIGVPLQIFLPEGTPYTFTRKYLWRPARAPVVEAPLAGRVRGRLSASRPLCASTGRPASTSSTRKIPAGCGFSNATLRRSWVRGRRSPQASRRRG